MCFLCLRRVLCVAIEVCVWHRKGCDGKMLLLRQGIDMAQRPRQLLWDVVKHPYHR